jgi:hypothetical protein
MKKSFIGMLLATMCMAVLAQGNPVIRGEISPGVYTNVAVDATGQVKTLGTAAPVTTSGSKTGGTAAADSSLEGGIYNTTLPTLTNGQQAAIQFGTRGSQMMQLMFPDSVTPVGVIAAGVDTAANATINALSTRGYSMVFNGTSWDRQVGTTAGTATIASKGTFTNRSGTITTGGTSQQIMAANAVRRYLFIQNVSDTVMWCNFTTAANTDQPSIQIAVGASFIMEGNAVTTEAVNCIGAVTGKSFTSKEM